MNEMVGNVTKSNNNLKSEVSKLKAHIESLEEAIAPDAVPETVEVEVHNQEVAARVTMNKESSEHRCHACDKLFSADKDLNSHIRDKHTESESVCHMNEKKFTTKKQAHEHICMEGEIVAQVCEKSYCKKEFVSSTALKDHMKTNHFGHQRSVCPKCGEICGNKGEIKKHMETCTKNSHEGKDKRERNKEVCYHWRRGNCNRGSSCGFSHVGKQDTHRPQAQVAANTPCRNGPTCTFHSRGRCRFNHQPIRRHQGEQYRNRDKSRQGKRPQAIREECKFGGDCDRVPNCPFLHNLTDFPQYNKSHGFRKTKGAKSNRNQYRS